ncbi:MAG: glycosyl hydrolase-related protein [Candidatus Delongbacteria bacterium]|jgi:alpha-mannosidase|nr:glycosyl hydrolase-related protein [Candidatus Delongbacteria bacterium]
MYEKQYTERIKQFMDRLAKLKYNDPAPLAAEYIYHKDTPIAYEKALKAKYKPIKVGNKWGDLWGCAWFKFTGKIPDDFAGKEVGVLINLDGEGCVFKNGVPEQGLTNRNAWYINSGKYFYPISQKAKKGQKIDLFVEAGANGLFGSSEDNIFKLKQAEIVTVDRKVYDLENDMIVLFELMKKLPENTPRKKKLLKSLNDITNIWSNGEGIDEALKITKKLLSNKANSSAMTVYSIGHAHIDLAWLWPVRESRRKAGRTFSTALKLMNEYPEYLFGSSQPQMYEWVKEDYPELYKKIKKAVKDKKWEVQGAMWAEPDMNIPSGESLVRQCLYGKKFFQDEFGIDVRNLWLPDVFGYSAALPQILRKSGVDVFMTQKISWNETNKFPHHTFYWTGIDGTDILTHFLPTNNYNLSNMPAEMIDSEERFAQSDVSDEFLNLYGIGDGGGGPSRIHIELGKRQQNLEGVPKFKFSFAEDFFKKIAKIPKEDLPSWSGELYLELHRGTYTTQGKIKKYNRDMEIALHDLEFLGTMIKKYPKEAVDQIWKDTLLNQFHDILPGSSIELVYKDAHELSEKNFGLLEQIFEKFFSELFDIRYDDNLIGNYMAFNALSWDKEELIKYPLDGEGNYAITDSNGKNIPWIINHGHIEFYINIPSMGYTTFTIEEAKKVSRQNKIGKATLTITESGIELENKLIKVTVDESGIISSIFDKEKDFEMVKFANKLLIWEDLPINWEAWDINHYYKETKPEQAQRSSISIIGDCGHQVGIEQILTIGNSTVIQSITIESNSKEIWIDNEIDWNEEKKFLKVHADTNIHSDFANYEIQFGKLKRPTHFNTSWDAARFEVPAQRFADLSQPDMGIAILNDCKYGHIINGTNIELSLLRSTKMPDEKADIGIHSFTYSYYPHANDLEHSDVLKKAHELNDPNIVIPISKLPKVKERSLYNIDSKSVKIDSVKRSEDGKGIIVRLYETMGMNDNTVLSFDKKYDVVETNLIEEKIKDLKKKCDSIELKFTPFEIKTIYLG